MSETTRSDDRTAVLSRPTDRDEQPADGSQAGGGAAAGALAVAALAVGVLACSFSASLAAGPSAIGSIAPATASSTGRCTPWPSAGCNAASGPAPSPTAAALRARPTRGIKRCLKCYIVRVLYRRLETPPSTA